MSTLIESIIKKLIHGGTPSRENEDFWSGDIPWITGADFENQQVKIVRRHITSRALRSSATGLVKCGDLLLVTRTGVGKLAIAPFDIAISQDITGITFHSEFVTTEFMYYLFQFKKDYFLGLNQGTSINGIKRKDLLSLEVDLLPVDNQVRIAKVLSIVDRAIEQTEALIAKQQRVKTGLMQDLLTKGIDENGNLRSEETHEFKDSPLGRIPVGWNIKLIKEISLGNIKNGLFKKPSLVGSGFPLVNVSDLYQDFEIDLNKVERLKVTGKEYASYSVLDGDCFFTRSSLTLDGIGHCNIVRIVNEKSVFECHVMRIRPDTRLVNPIYLAYYCRFYNSRLEIIKKSQQTTMTTISQSVIENLFLPLPALEEQNKIIDLLDQASLEIKLEVRNKEKLQRLKNGLMQDLLTGNRPIDPLLEEGV